MIIINNEQDLRNILNTRIHILQFISICVKAVIVHIIHNYINKDIHKNLFNITNDTELLINILHYIEFSEQDIQIIENCINEYIKVKKIHINELIKLQINDTDLKNFLKRYLLNSPYWNLIKRELKIIQNKQLPLTLKEILNKNLQVGEQIPLSENIIKKELHSLYVTPLIYINGNIIWGNKQSVLNVSTAEREYHNQILLRYLNNESLHKNDIIHLPINKWKQCNIYNMYNICDYVRLVSDNNIFIILYDEPNKLIAAKKIYQKYQQPVFTITDNVLNLQRLASRLLEKNYKYLIRIY